MGTTNDAALTDEQALEQFVIANDDLLELEERVGRFNIFDSLRIARTEIRHSNFLAWLLDPSESHGQGGLFLNAILMDLISQMPADLRPLNPVELDGVDLQGVEIRREWRNIDLLIVCKQPEFVIAIENKIGSSEHGNQLARYQEIVSKEFSKIDQRAYVFLTTDGDEASQEDWVSYSYADIYRVLNRCRRNHESAIGADVLTFLDHYLRLIESRFMDNPELDALCQRIYKNHRQALDLIFERVAVGGSEGLIAIEKMLREQPEQWHVFNKTTRVVEFIPKSWEGIFPAIGTRPKFDSKIWLVLSFEITNNVCRFYAIIWPTSDPELRQQVLKRLTQKSNKFRITPKKEAGPQWARLCNEVVYRWQKDTEPDLATLKKKVKDKIDDTADRFSGVAEALQPIFDGR